MQIMALCNRPAWRRHRCITKTMLVMKLTTILILSASLGLSAHGLSQTVTFSGKDVPLEKVFSIIKEQTGYVVFFDHAIVDNSKTVTLSVKEAPLQNFLSQILQGQLLDYTIRKKTIFIKKMDAPDRHPDNAPGVMPPVAITGRILDMDGKPLAGASIAIKGGRVSAVTDANGKFTINASAGDVLVISFVGFAPREIAVGSALIASAGQQPDMGDIKLALSTSSLDEIQIIGYGTTTRRLSTGSVSKITSAEIEQQPVSNPILALEGKAPGLFITQNARCYRHLWLKGCNGCYINYH
jgi:hypothetical protein